ncbi:MAG: hypothetical protein K2H43_03455 [Clostridia bacterium]|nr:hypothetical protein [Clostridia bacterium]
MSNIRIFNVNFGDCFLLECGENAKMLVDYGSSTRLSPAVTTQVNAKLLHAKHLYLTLTHFHKDHYSGIQKLGGFVQFDEVYLPNFFSKEHFRLQFALLFALSPTHESAVIAKNLLSVIPDLQTHLRSDSAICYVNRGDTILNRTGNYRILWPQLPDSDAEAQRLYRELRPYLESDESILLVNRAADHYFEALSRTYEDDGGIRRLAAESIDFERIREVLYSFASSKKRFQPPKRLTRKLSKAISDYQNSICLCFDTDHGNSCSNNGKPALFLSDIDPANYKIIAAGKDGLKLADVYSAIKVPHHGTKNYYINDLPESDFLIISNGKSAHSGWEISPLYGLRYIGRELLCTNYKDACGYEPTGKQCFACDHNYCTCGIGTDDVLPY